jgi:2-dehydropantoate 2-reductase
MRIAIVGAGGVGGWLAAKLLRHGADETVVVLREGSRNVAALRQGGLSYRAVEEGDVFEIPPAAITVAATGPELAGVGPVDALILGVKSFQVTEATPGIRTP